MSDARSCGQMWGYLGSLFLLLMALGNYWVSTIYTTTSITKTAEVSISLKNGLCVNNGPEQCHPFGDLEFMSMQQNVTLLFAPQSMPEDSVQLQHDFAWFCPEFVSQLLVVKNLFQAQLWMFIIVSAFAWVGFQQTFSRAIQKITRLLAALTYFSALGCSCAYLAVASTLRSDNTLCPGRVSMSDVGFGYRYNFIIVCVSLPVLASFLVLVCLLFKAGCPLAGDDEIGVDDIHNMRYTHDPMMNANVVVTGVPVESTAPVDGAVYKV